MTKKYSPVQVHNPTSLQHLVRLHPGQDICMSFDMEMYKDIKVEVSSQYLRKIITYEKSGKQFHHFKQEELVEDWHEYSSCFLGEVWIDCNDFIAKVVIVLESGTRSKLDHLTVVNPDCYDVRMLPHQIIELVVFDLRFGNQDEWNCEWRAIEGVHVEQIGYDFLSLYSWNQFLDSSWDAPDYRYARYPRMDEVCDGQQCRQHHFWFRFDKTILDMADAGVKHVGDFLVSGCADKFLKGSADESSYHASVYVDSSKIKKGRILHTLGLMKKESYSQYNYKHVEEPWPRQTSARTFPKQNSIIHVPQKRRRYKKPKEVLPQTKEVAINRIQTTSFEEGCKILEAIPSEKWTADSVDYNYYDEPEYGWYGQGYGNGIIPYHKHRGAMD